MIVKSKAEARRIGESLFFTGRECKRGHVDFRRATNSNCLSCEKIINKNHYQSDPEKHRDKARQWRKENPDKLACQSKLRTERIRENQSLRESINAKARARYSSDGQYRASVILSGKRYRDNNKERLNLRCKQKRQQNLNKIRAADRDRYQKDRTKILARNKTWTDKNKESVIQYKKEWIANNPEKLRAARWRRKALIKKAEGAFSDSDILRLRDLQRDLCACCKKSIADYYEIDHIMPLFLGGSNWPENLQLLCRPCNRSKWAKDPIQWANENGKLI